MRRILRVISICSTLPLLVAASLLALPGRGTLYGTDGRNGNLLTVDPTTGAGTLVGSIAGGIQIRSLAVDPATGILYAGTGGSQALLYRVDPTTGLGTLVSDTGLGKAMISGMDFAPDGRLYASVNLTGSGGTGGDHLAIIDSATGVATVVGSFGTCTGVAIPSTGTGSCTIEGIEGLAFDPHGVLWGVLRGSGVSVGAPGLYRISRFSGQASFEVPVQDALGNDVLVTSLQFSCGGTLYAGTGGAGTPTASPLPVPPSLHVGFLATIDPTTGKLAYVGASSATGGLQDLSGLAFAVGCGVTQIPALDPLALVLLGLLLAAAGWFALARCS